MKCGWMDVVVDGGCLQMEGGGCDEGWFWCRMAGNMRRLWVEDDCEWWRMIVNGGWS